MTDAEIDVLADRVAARLWPKLRDLLACQPEPVARKLTVADFAQCIQRSAYWVNEQTRINPALRRHVQGKRPKLIHPAALALFGVDPGLAAARLAKAK